MGMKPDLITVAKGITSAYVPLSACMVSEKVWRTIVNGGDTYGTFAHGYTYSAHPLAAAAALANLKLIEDENLVEQAASRGRFMHQLLAEAFSSHPMVGDIRGFGLIGAVEFVARRNPATRFDPALKVAARITKAALRRGLITRALPNADTISFSPPFVISEEEITEMVSRARAAADEVMAEMVSECSWKA